MNIQLKWIYRLAIGLLVCLLAFIIYLLYPTWSGFFYLVWICSVPFLISAFISYLLRPIIRRLENWGLKKWLAITLVYLVFIVGAFFTLYKGLPVFFEQVQDFMKSAPELAKTYQSFVKQFERGTVNLPFGLHDKLNNLLDHFEGKISKQVVYYGQKIEHFPSFFVVATLIPFITFYMLRDHDIIGKYFNRLIPKKWGTRVNAFVSDLNESLGNYVRGQIFVSLLVGVLSYIVFLLIGMKYPLPLATIIAITNVIPTFGPIIGAIPVVLIAFTISKAMVIKVLITVVVLQMIEGNMIAPFIIGKSMAIHPLFIMLALIVGEKVAGIAGLIFSVPILAILKISIFHARSHFRSSKKSLTQENEL